MSNETTEIRDMNFPPSALTTCPDRRYGLVSITGCCQRCSNFLGLYDVMPEDAPFAVKYRVRCSVPQAREIVVFETGE